MKFLLTTCAAVLLAASTSAQVVRVTVAGITWAQKDLLAAVNKVRAQYSKPALCLNAKLTNASQEHVYDMAGGGWVASLGTGGTSPTMRAIAQKFNTTGVAEVAAAGYETAATAVQELANTPEYSPYILGNYTYMGAGYTYNAAYVYKTFWVLDFDNQAVGEVCAQI